MMWYIGNYQIVVDAVHFVSIQNFLRSIPENKRVYYEMLVLTLTKTTVMPSQLRVAVSSTFLLEYVWVW